MTLHRFPVDFEDATVPRGTHPAIGGLFVYDRGRALLFTVGQDALKKDLREWMAMALTLHAR